MPNPYSSGLPGKPNTGTWDTQHYPCFGLGFMAQPWLVEPMKAAGQKGSPASGLTDISIGEFDLTPMTAR